MIKNKNIIFGLFLAIIIIASILRLWQIGNVPPSPDWDEVALGYDAYSILQTGRDQFGQSMPIVLRSLDDFKPALYAYLSIPSVFVFGLNTFAVRLPSALFGILSIIAVFYLVKEIFDKYKYRDYLALLSSFMMAISPWSIQFSRVAFESNVGTVFNILTALFFLKGLKKPWFLYVSAIFAGISIYTYQSEKIFIPLLILGLTLIYRKRLLSLNRKYILFPFILGVIISLPMVLYTLTNSSSLQRLQGTSIFASQRELLEVNVRKINRNKETENYLALVLDNRRIVYTKIIVQGYLSHFDLNWLFLEGDTSRRHHAPGMGLLYLFELPFILIGIYMLLFGDFDRKIKLLIFLWFFLAPLPASITTGVPHAVRALNFLPIYQIFSALGILYLLINSNRYKKGRYIFYAVFIFIFAFNISYYLNQYFVQLNHFYSQDWQYGYEEVVSKVNSIENKYDRIVVSEKWPLEKSYEFFLFYLKYPPQEYQRNGAYNKYHAFGKFTFREIDWKKDSLRKNILYIGTPGEFPSEIKSLQEINNLDGTPVMKIVGT